MALTITKLKMWKDPGYTRGCLEVPPAGSKKLPATPDYELAASDTLRPHKDSTLTRLNLPLSFTSVFDMSYLYIEATDGGGTVKLFGWIDSITQRSTSQEGVTVEWTVDWWRSYSGNVTWGIGRILKCSDSAYRRPYRTQPRFWTVKHKEKLITPSESAYASYPYCVIVSYNTKTPDPNDPTRNIITEISYLYWLSNASAGETFTSGGITYNAPSIAQIFRGELDELLGILPEDINGIFIAPIAPFIRSQSSIISHDYNGVKWFAYKMPSLVTMATFNSTYTNDYTSDDNLKTVIVDPNGSIVYTLPWGYTIKKITAGMDSGAVSCNFKFRLLTASEDTVESASTGKMGTIPSLTAPMNTNAISSYNYSGQRDYDIEMKNIQRDQQTVAGLQSAGTSAIAGGVGGSLTGKGNAGIGALVAAGTSLLGTGVNWYATGIFNDRLQDATDKLMSNQASNIIQSGEGTAFLNSNISPTGWYIVQLEADTVSATEYADHIAVNGHETDLSANVSTFIAAGGPLQITSLNLTGSLPPQAKEYIKNMFSNGVIIQENNPSGVTP